MSNNPYTPPTAPVSDVAPSAMLQRPREVQLAIGLFWASFAVSLVMYAGDPDLQAGDPDDVIPMVIGIIIGSALLIALMLLIARARNWARITYVVLSGLGWMSVVASWAEVMAQPWHQLLGYLVTLVLDVAVFVLLFRPASNAWFRGRGLAAPAT